jgi:phospholipase C
MANFRHHGAVSAALFVVFIANLQSAHSQTYTPPPHFSHIVIIIQENRTPDDLFGGAPVAPSSKCGGFNGFTRFIDLANGGPNNYSGHKGCSSLTKVKDLNTGGGTHSNKDWQGQWDNGAMDGACNPNTDPTANCGESSGPPNPPYVYAEKNIVQPYLDMAENYGWANYMFQTNEGPSFPAHQFLFGGTSAPFWPTEKYADYFVADNPGNASGCTKEDSTLNWVDPTGDPDFKYPTPISLDVNPYECYDRNTMVTTQKGPTGPVSPRIDKAGAAITWAYYTQSKGTIWDAPEADPQTCYGLYEAPAGNPPCSGSEFSHVILPGTGNGESAPIFNDIAKCNLNKITWVTPDGVWSDHPGDLGSQKMGYPALGPSWVADIIDAIGESKTNSKGKCDYWSAEPTAIFVTWDDWGGFYDHVSPPAVLRSKTPTKCTTANGKDWGCGYVYGFRVPLLVISPYTKAGTVSGPLSPTGTFPPPYPPPPQWTHDFGSILCFTEQNFYPAGSAHIAPRPYTYADGNTFDSMYMGQTVVPLWEFFNSPTILPFTEISAPYPASFFQNYYNTPNANGQYPTPTGADDDGDED